MRRKSIITKLCCLLLVVTLLPIWTTPTIAAQTSEQAVPTPAISNVQLQDTEGIYSVTALPLLTQEVLWDVLGPTPTPLPIHWADLEREEQHAVSLTDEVLWDVLGPVPTSFPSSWASLEREEQQAVLLMDEVLWDVLGPVPTSFPSSWVDLEREEQLAIMENGLTPAIYQGSIMTDLQSDVVFETMLPPAVDNPFVYEIVFETVLPPAVDSSFVEESLSGNIIYGTELPMLQVCTPLDETEFLSAVDSFALGYEHFIFDDYLDYLDDYLDYLLDGVISDTDIMPFSSLVTILYHGNGHTGGSVPANQVLNTPGSITLRPQGNLTRTGHTFGGWRDGIGIVRPAGSTVTWLTAVSGTVTMTAVWIPVTNNVITIQYRSNGHTGGTVPASQTIVTPGTTNVSSQGTLTRTGHTFGGWRDTHTGNVIAAGQLVGWSTAVTATVTLDAIWTPIITNSIVTINYRGNGHTGGTVPASQTIFTPGMTNVRAPGTLTRTGHTFGGWRDTHTGNVIAPSQVVGWSTAVTATVTLDAIWNPITTNRYSNN